MSETKIQVLTLNCWGLKYVSKHRVKRIQAIAHELSRSDYDIIALQELWVYSDYKYVQECVSKRLPQSKFFYSGALGAGLAIFTRFPIIETSVHPYSLNGAPIDVTAGDWFVGKAAASVVILHPLLGQVQVFNTHLFAKGGEDGPEYNRAHRLVNAYEFSKLARQAAERGRYVIALGDFNSIPPTLPMTLILQHAALTDAWAQVYPSTASATSDTTITNAMESLTRFGITADSPTNTWSASKKYAFGTWGKRLDYVLYRQPSPIYSPHRFLNATQCKVVFTGNVPGHEFSYSDHFGLESTLEIQEPLSNSLSNINSNASSEFSEVSSVALNTTIHALTTCYRFSRQRAKNELSIFGLCILLLLCLIVGSAWLPHSWISPLFVLFAIFIAWLATTMLYEGFLYGNWECNALMNVIEEMEVFKKGMQLQESAIRTSGEF